MTDSSTDKKIVSVKEFYNAICSQYYNPEAHAVSCKVREINEEILKALRSKIAGPILDVGCGCQKPVSDSIGCDLSIETIKRRRKLFPHSRFVCADLNTLPFVNKHFSGIFAGLLFDHLEDPGLAFSSLREVAAQGAKLILTIYDMRALPCFAYLNNILEYETENGNIYRVPSYQRDFRELQGIARQSGWSSSSDIISHETASVAYYLLQLEFRLNR